MGKVLFFTNILSKFYSILFPKLCQSCNELSLNSAAFCDSCYQLICMKRGNHCFVCGIPFVSSLAISHVCGACLKSPPAYEQHRSCFEYQGPLVKAIHQLKFKNDLSQIRSLGIYLTNLYFQMNMSVDLLIPVPLHLKKIRRRTYNQSLELCRFVSREVGIPFDGESLRKIEETQPQKGLKRKSRLRNVRNSFFWEGGDLSGKTICLVDDVYTTGATLRAASRALKKAKAQKIVGLTLAQSTGG